MGKNFRNRYIKIEVETSNGWLDITEDVKSVNLHGESLAFYQKLPLFIEAFLDYILGKNK